MRKPNGWYSWRRSLAALAIVSAATVTHGQRGKWQGLTDEQYIAELSKGLDALRAEYRGNLCDDQAEDKDTEHGFPGARI